MRQACTETPEHGWPLSPGHQSGLKPVSAAVTGGLNEKRPGRLPCLAAWSPVGGAIFGRLWSLWDLAGGSVSLSVGLEVFVVSPYFLSAVSCSTQLGGESS